MKISNQDLAVLTNQYIEAKVRDFPEKRKHLRLISCLLYGFLLYMAFCRPIISMWALLENNALESELALYQLQA